MFRKKLPMLLFLLPGLAGILVFYVVPFVWGIYYSVTDGTIRNEFVGFQNYLQVWQNPMFQLGLRNTMELSLICAPLIFVLSFFIAGMLRNLKERSTAYRNLLLMPYLMPSAAMMLIWLLLFDYNGMLNRLVVGLGSARVEWLTSGALRVPVVLLYVWKNLGFSVVIFTSALQAVPDAYYEYASLEGAGPIRQEISITLPMVAPTAFLIFVLAWINAFKVFKEIYYIGGAYPQDSVYTLQHFMSNQYAKLNYQYITTSAYSFAVIVMVIFGLLYFLQRRNQRA